MMGFNLLYNFCLKCFVEWVIWDEVIFFCKWIGGCLFMDWEWVHVVRGGVKYICYGLIDVIVWYWGNVEGRIYLVGKCRVN